MRAARPIRNLAVLANAPSPYHAYFLRRLSEELRPMSVHALFTHSTTFQPWTVDPPEGIRQRSFASEGERIDDPVRGRALTDYRKGGRILDYLEAESVEAVICQGYDRPDFLRVLWGSSRRGSAVFLRADSNVSDDDANSFWKRAAKRAFLKTLLSRVAGVMVVGRSGFAYYRRYGVPRERVFLVPLEPDYEAIRSVDPKAVARIRTAESLEEGRRRILYCGRLAPVKRVDLLLLAFEAIAHRRPAWDLIIAGDGPVRSNLESMVSAGLRTRVQWMGFRDVNEIQALYHCCDVLALPSEREPWALVVNEAMAAGLAVVVSDVVGAGPDLVAPGVNGAVFRNGDARALETALLEVTDAARLRRLREGAASRLAAWRREGDPVEGVRAALASAGFAVPTRDDKGPPGE